MELWELVARESCRDTLAQYTHAGDRFLLEEFAAAFCEDGVLEIRGSEPITGRAAIMERFGGGDRGPQARQAASARSRRSASRRIVRHNVTNIRFESVSPDEATVAELLHRVHRDRPRPHGPLPGPLGPRRRPLADRAPLRLDGLARPTRLPDASRAHGRPRVAATSPS